MDSESSCWGRSSRPKVSKWPTAWVCPLAQPAPKRTLGLATHTHTHLLLLSVVSSRAESLPLPEEELCELR